MGIFHGTLGLGSDAMLHLSLISTPATAARLSISEPV